MPEVNNKGYTQPSFLLDNHLYND